MKFSSTRLGKCAVGVLLLSGAMILTTRPAGAFFGQSHAYSSCLDMTGAPSVFYFGGNISTTGSLLISCPVTDSSAIQRSLLTVLDVYYDDETTSGFIYAQRCVEYGSVTGGSCGNTVQSSTSGTGVGTLHVPNTPASFATDWNGSGFGHVVVNLPPKTAGGAVSELKGVYEQQP